MNSRKAGCRRASAVLFFAALCVGKSLWAEASVKVLTPGTSFNKVGTKGRVDDVADGRRFRGEASDRLEVSAPLRVPQPAAPGLSKTELQRMIIRFRTSPDGPILRSVKCPTPRLVPIQTSRATTPVGKRPSLRRSRMCGRGTRRSKWIRTLTLLWNYGSMEGSRAIAIARNLSSCRWTRSFDLI